MDKIGTKYENGRVIHQYIDTDISKNTFDKCGYTAAELINAVESINRRMKYSEHLKKDEMLCKIKKVIFNNPATIVIWANGDKTVVKCDGEKFDPEKGLAMAITKYLLGNNHGYYYDIFDKWLPKKKTHSKKTVLKAVEKVRKNFDKEQVVRKYEY